MRRFTSLAAAAAVVVTSFGIAATPAEARKRYGHRHHDRISTGEVIGGILILGTIAAIASSANRDRADRRERRERRERYDPPYREQNYREVPRYEPQDAPTPGAYGRGEAEARAADACGWAVEAEMGDDARVDSIDRTEPNGGGWYVTGTASRLGGGVESFGCTFRNGRVVDVRFGG